MNQRAFFSFRKPADWSSGTSYHLQAEQDGLQIIRERIYRQVKRTTIPFSNEQAQIIDMVCAADGRWYALDSLGSIWRTDLVSKHIELVMKLEHKQYVPSKLAVQHERMIVLSQGEQGSLLQCFVLDHGQLKWSTTQWYEASFEGYELLVLDNEEVVIIGKLPHRELLQLLRFDAIGMPILNIELPKPPEHAPIVLESALQAANFFIVQGNAQHVLIADRKGRRLLSWDMLSNQFTLVPLAIRYDALSALAYAHGSYWLLLRHASGKGSELIAFNQQGAVLRKGELELAAGRYLCGSHNQLFIWNGEKHDIYTITPRLETAYWKDQLGHTGVWISRSLDSKLLGTVWHKLKLQLKNADDTSWNVRYFASDSLEISLPHGIVQFDHYLADSSISMMEKLGELEGIWQHTLLDPEDALLHGAVGKYLWINLELIGTAQHSPVIEGMEIYFPHSSFIDELPAIYLRDAASKDFLSRYLSMFQSMLEETDLRIASAPRTLEPRQVAGDSLRWLCSWLGIEADDYWSEEQLKQLLLVAPKLYSQRGTRYAIETVVTIYTGHPPIILEYEDIKPLKENAELGEVVERLYAADPHAFNVLVKAEHVDTELKRVTLQHILDRFKPVFSICKLVILQPWVYMDLHSYLGMNTVLSEPTLLKLDGRSSMPHHTITIDVGQDNRIDKHTRLGLNSRLE